MKDALGHGRGNPNHDARGRFASGDGGSGSGAGVLARVGKWLDKHLGLGAANGDPKKENPATRNVPGHGAISRSAPVAMHNNQPSVGANRTDNAVAQIKAKALRGAKASATRATNKNLEKEVKDSGMSSSDFYSMAKHARENEGGTVAAFGSRQMRRSSSGDDRGPAGSNHYLRLARAADRMESRKSRRK